MTQNKKFKRKVRERMALTGESYTAARKKILENPCADFEVAKDHDCTFVIQGPNGEDAVCTRCGRVVDRG